MTSLPSRPSDRSTGSSARYVGVVGPGDADAHTYRNARRAGELIVTELTAIVVCGGLAGVMEGAARGASDAGGFSVGFLPGLDRSAANPYLSVAVPTGMGELRDGLVVNTSDALVVIGGSWGTLAEVSLAAKRGLPVVCVGGWTVGDADGVTPSGLVHCGTPEAAVAELARLLTEEH